MRPLSSPTPASGLSGERRKILILGADGQLGRALRRKYARDPRAEFAGRQDLALIADRLESARAWDEYGTIINAAAFTSVDRAETPRGRAECWATNVAATASLARIAATNSITLVQISSDYVFDGISERPYREDDAVCPLGVYGQTKAAADMIVATVRRHYVVRTSWVIGDGNNFIRTMLSLAERGVDPNVVNDQWGRLTFTSQLAEAIHHLLEKQCAFGTYNVSSSGPVITWADVAQHVFSIAGHCVSRISPVETRQYLKTVSGPFAPRPRNGALDLDKIIGSGYEPAPAHELIADYVRDHALGRAGNSNTGHHVR